MDLYYPLWPPAYDVPYCTPSTPSHDLNCWLECPDYGCNLTAHWGEVFLPSSYTFYLATPLLDSGHVGPWDDGAGVSVGTMGQRKFGLMHLDVSIGYDTAGWPDDPLEDLEPGTWIGANDGFGEGKPTEDWEDDSPCHGSGNYPVINTGVTHLPIDLALFQGINTDDLCGDLYERLSLTLQTTDEDLARIFTVDPYYYYNPGGCADSWEKVAATDPIDEFHFKQYPLDERGKWVGWQFYLEGLRPGTVLVELDGVIDGDCSRERIDRILVHIAKIDVDVDSDNTNDTAPYGPDAPAGEHPGDPTVEDRIEQRAGERGRFVLLNDDDDNRNGKPDSDPTDTGPIQDEDDLVEIKITAPDFTPENPDWVKWSLSVPSYVDIWENPNKTGLHLSSGEHEFAWTEHPLPKTWYIQGWYPAGPLQITAKLLIDLDGEGSQNWYTPVHQDTVQVTVVKPNLGADSNNDGYYSGSDEIIEDRSDLPGLYVGMNDNFDEEDDLEDFETPQASKKPCPAGQYAVVPTNDLEPIYVSLVPGGDSLYGECDLCLKGGRDHLRVYAIRWGSCDAACPATGENVCWKLIDENCDLAANYLHSQGPIHGWALYVEGILPGEAQMLLEFWHDGHKLYEDQVNFTVVQIDVDVDSDNTNTNDPYGPDAPDPMTEDRIEEKNGEPGRFVLVNDDDDDQDGILDYDDGYNKDGIGGNADDWTYKNSSHREDDFVMLKVKIEPDTLDVSAGHASLKITYDAASPDPTVPGNGKLRLWRRPGDDARDGRSVLPAPHDEHFGGGDWVGPGTYDDLSKLTPNGVASRTMTFYIEGVSPSATLGDAPITFELDPDGPDGPSGFVHKDVVRVTTVRMNLGITGVIDSDEDVRGGVITLNNDNDDFNPPGPHNYDPDREQNGPVPGEDDLQQITLDTSLTSQTTAGQLRLEISAGTSGNNADDTIVKVWREQTKGTVVLDGASKVRTWTIAEFNALRPVPGQPVSFWVEGFKRSVAVKDVELKFSYRKDPAAQTAGLQDTARYAVVEMMLDVNRDIAPTDDNPSYLPGYDVGTPPSPVLSPTQAYQEMQLLALPITIGTTTDRLTDTARFEIVETTHIPGWCMNQGHQNGGDYSFAQAANTYLNDVKGNTGIHVTQPFYCKDDGGRCTVQLKLLRDNVQLTVCELRVPRDTDRDWLPDRWETDYGTEPSPPNTLIFDPRNPETTGPGHIDRHYDLDVLPVTPGTLAAIDRNPQDGRRGDGLTAFEEYRGFVYRDLSEHNPRHYRLDPHRKDLFGVSEIADGADDMQLGELPTALADLLVHRLDRNAASEEFVAASRVVNYNRATDADAYPAGWPQDQKCLRFVVDNGLPAAGVTAGPAIDTGPDGVCQTQARASDAQPIPLGRGLANAVAIRPGPNGIIDPQYDTANDVLNVAAMQVQMGADGRLTSLNPQDDDRVRGRVRGTSGVLQQATVAAMNAADVLAGEIQEGPDSHLELATVAGVTGDDSLASVVIAGGFDGFLQTLAAGDDVLDPIGQTISPGLNGVFDSAIDAMDEYRGTVEAGPDGILQSRPANENDVVVGTIEEGTDSNLQSRPAHPDDHVEGYMDPGPDGVFYPLLNNDRTSNVRAQSPPLRDADDGFDQDNMTIATGADGLLSTTASGDDELAFQVGQGQPYSDCVTNTLIVNATPNTLATGVGTGGDDGYAGEAAGAGDALVNLSPNEHMPIRINVALFQGFTSAAYGYRYGANGRDEGGPPNGDDVNVDLTGGANAASRHSWIRKTMTHEGGHGVHCEHYSPLRRDVDAAGNWIPPAAPPALHAAGEVTYTHDRTRLFPGRNPPAPPTDFMRSDIWQQNAPGGQYDAVTVDQIRLHIKHNP